MYRKKQKQQWIANAVHVAAEKTMCCNQVTIISSFKSYTNQKSLCKRQYVGEAKTFNICLNHYKSDMFDPTAFAEFVIFPKMDITSIFMQDSH